MSPTTLPGRVDEIETMLEEENNGSCEVELALENLSLSILVVGTEPEEEKTAHLGDLKAS